MATRSFISGIGGDQAGSLYALVPAPKGPGISSVIKLETNGAAKTLGNIQLPLKNGRQPAMAGNLAVVGSHLAVFGFSGDIAWYKLPLA